MLSDILKKSLTESSQGWRRRLQLPTMTRRAAVQRPREVRSAELLEVPPPHKPLNSCESKRSALDLSCDSALRGLRTHRQTAGARRPYLFGVATYYCIARLCSKRRRVFKKSALISSLVRGSHSVHEFCSPCSSSQAGAKVQVMPMQHINNFPWSHAWDAGQCCEMSCWGRDQKSQYQISKPQWKQP